ncbi:TetR family transcriptional regulator [Actinopolyspora mortivallis]|uniref:TetR family transcriptional regulator n=1 Tax=Actinopolyspora mortivallis TaxID=33906 RepID=A0A2T0GSJ5_ACTMO|nr:TetR family transcriptional regulator [Actinopolyspora mortivallis]PRW62086.1 TetR family transcriptional regulator [Actinopolyspora mortivallis]
MPTEAAPLRRKPVQQRSAQRVERMLEACAQLIDEVGYDGLTTTLIAERAGVAVGSLYQFFPDKRAVVQELTLRNLEKFVQAVYERLDRTELAHWWDAVDTVFDVYLGMHRETPAFSKLHFGDVVDLRLLHENKDNNAVIAEKLTNLISEHFGMSPSELELPLSVAVEAADAVLHLAFRRAPMGDPTLVNEARELVRGYLSSRISEDQPKDLPSPR